MSAAMSNSDDWKRAKREIAENLYNASRAGKYSPFSDLPEQEQEKWLKKAQDQLDKDWSKKLNP